MAQKKTKKTYSMPEKQRLLCRWTFELAAFLQEEHNMDKKAALELAHLNRELILHLGSGRVWFVYMKEDGSLREAQGTLCNGISQKFDEYEYKNNFSTDSRWPTEHRKCYSLKTQWQVTIPLGPLTTPMLRTTHRWTRMRK